MIIFDDRKDAGRQLAEALADYAGNDNVLVLALPRGGVPVAFEVSKALRAPLDVMVVRKLGVPGHSELAMGAIASGNIEVLNEHIVAQLDISRQAIEQVADKERRELARREQAYRGDKPPYEVKGKIIILVDDGIATGATMRAAIAAINQQRPEELVVAVPTSAQDSYRKVAAEADRVVCLETPEPYFAVGQWYRNFNQTSDETVAELLQLADKYYRKLH